MRARQGGGTGTVRARSARQGGGAGKAPRGAKPPRRSQEAPCARRTQAPLAHESAHEMWEAAERAAADAAGKAALQAQIVCRLPASIPPQFLLLNADSPHFPILASFRPPPLAYPLNCPVYVALAPRGRRGAARTASVTGRSTILSPRGVRSLTMSSTCPRRRGRAPEAADHGHQRRRTAAFGPPALETKDPPAGGGGL